MSFLVAVITISDRAAAGVYQDRSGPLAQELLQAAGFSVPKIAVVPDESAAIKAAIRAAHQAGARAIITTGGTGIGPRDITPENGRASCRESVEKCDGPLVLNKN